MIRRSKLQKACTDSRRAIVAAQTGARIGLAVTIAWTGIEAHAQAHARKVASARATIALCARAESENCADRRFPKWVVAELYSVASDMGRGTSRLADSRLLNDL